MSINKPNTATAADDEDITWEEIAYWAEFCGWTVLALAPFLRWINGPSVSTDQYYMRIGLVIVACLLYTSPSPRDATLSRMPSSA